MIKIFQQRWWLKEVTNVTTCAGQFPNCLPDGKKYELIYLSCVDFVLSDDDYIAFLRKIKNITSAPINISQFLRKQVMMWCKKVNYQKD